MKLNNNSFPALLLAGILFVVILNTINVIRKVNRQRIDHPMIQYVLRDTSSLSKYSLQIYPIMDGCDTKKQVGIVEVYLNDSLITILTDVEEFNLKCNNTKVFQKYHVK